MLIERWGAGALGEILDDLARDVPMNAALARHTEPIEKLDESFAKWLRERAEKLAPKVDWEKPELPPDADHAAIAAWNKEHPNSFYGLLAEGRALMAERKFKEALVPLATAAELYPTYGEDDGPYLRMAAVQRELGDAQREREMLEKHVALDAEGIEPRLRLMELAAGAQDWPAVQKYADQTLAVNPLIAPPHQYLAQAAEALGDRAVAIEARRTLLLLDPLDPAEQHYRVATLLAEDQQLAAAEKEAVLALEEAPRYRAAHRLLVEIVDRMDRSGEPRLSAPASRPASAPQPEAKPEPKPAPAPAPAPESGKPPVAAPAAPTPEPAR